MNKRGIAMALCAALLAAGGCAAGTPSPDGVEEGSYLIYYSALKDPDGESAVEGEYRSLPEGQEAIPGLVELLRQQPQTEGLTPALPAGLRLLDWQLEEGRLQLDVSEHYYSLSGVDLTLADACLTLTLCQLEEVDSVYLTVEGRELPYRTIQRLTAGDILMAGGADEPMSLNVDLWYLRQEGQSLGVERRQIVKDLGQTTVEAVLSAWAQGPEESDLRAALPEGCRVLAAEVHGGVCAVDLSAEFLEGLPRSETTAALMIYALVNTLCELDGVEAVQLYLDGQPAPAVGGLPLDRALIPDLTLEQPG